MGSWSVLGQESGIGSGSYYFGGNTAIDPAAVATGKYVHRHLGINSFGPLVRG